MWEEDIYDICGCCIYTIIINNIIMFRKELKGGNRSTQTEDRDWTSIQKIRTIRKWKEYIEWRADITYKSLHQPLTLPLLLVLLLTLPLLHTLTVRRDEGEEMIR